jgi:hypothetical protein
MAEELKNTTNNKAEPRNEKLVTDVFGGEDGGLMGGAWGENKKGEH